MYILFNYVLMYYMVLHILIFNKNHCLIDKMKYNIIQLVSSAMAK